MAEAKSVKL